MEDFFKAAWEAAEAAAILIRGSWQRTKQIDYKSAVDLVTATDRQSERRIVEVLHQRFPSHSILAEEEASLVGHQSDHRWIIDPLDGTTNFVHGYPHFCVSIGLEREGEVILGLVYDPLRGECFRGAKGKGASVNGAPVRTSGIKAVDKALLATGFPYDRRERAEVYLAFFKAFMMRSQGIRRNGSAALDLCYLACGRIDGFWELKLRPWDTAAGSLIVQEAGGMVSDFSGNPFSIWAGETLASNGFIHSEMVRIATEVAHGDKTLTPP